jgi:hypothetical protein
VQLAVPSCRSIVYCIIMFHLTESQL